LLYTLLAAAPAVAQSALLEKGEREAVIDKIGDLLTVNYIFPDRASWAKAEIARGLAAGDYDKITDPAAFAERLTTDLRTITHDKHVGVAVTSDNGQPVNAPPLPPSNAGFTRIDRLKGNIGYIKILGFAELAPFIPAVDQAMADLESTHALIIDLRESGGGSAASETYFCSFFFDPRTPVHLDDFVRRKPGTQEFTTEEWWTQAVTTPYLRKPVYDLMSFDAANTIRAQLPALQADISKLGAIKTVTFNGIGPYDSLDVYDVTLANGTVQCGIFVTPDGKIASVWVRPAAAQMPDAR